MKTTFHLIRICLLCAATLFAVAVKAQTIAFTTLASFTYTNPPNYGWNFEPYNGRTGALVEGDDGNFYGTTYMGGLNYILVGQPSLYGCGTLFRVTPGGTFTSLYSFGDIQDEVGHTLDGCKPLGNLLKGADGALYGTTLGGGALYTDPQDPYSNKADGTIFQITTNGAFASLWFFGHDLAWNTTYNCWTSTDGMEPFAGVVQGRDCNFYGTTHICGACGQGTVFQLTPGGTLTTLHSFTDDLLTGGMNSDGAGPFSELVEGNDGCFYGTTYWGGANGYGTIFRITSDGTFTTLFSFNNGPAGYATIAPLVMGSDGNLYGTTTYGDYPCRGAIFRITTNGDLTVLHSFQYVGGDPSGLIQSSDGNFYGTTQAGGNCVGGFDMGTIFRITTNGTYTTLYAFSGPDGDWPQGALVQAKDGSFYGTTSYGGPGFDPLHSVMSGYGTIFRFVIPPVFQSLKQTNGLCALTWSIMPGQTYQLQWNTNLGSTNWFNLGSPVTATNTTACATDCMTNSQCFYRIMLAP